MITREFEASVKRFGHEDVDVPVHVTLAYHAGVDPFAVEVIFEIEGDEDRIWTIGRDLMESGWNSMTPYGEGDVRFRYFPDRSAVLMCLRSHEGHADIALPAQEVSRFLDETSGAARVTEQERTSLVDEFLKEVFEA
jgi:hypothetical protein